jgi:hypothetical protein
MEQTTDNNPLIDMLKLCIESDDIKTFPLNVVSETCGEHQITLSVEKQRDYSDTDDSEFVKKIKSLNVLDEDDITFKNGYIFSKEMPGSWGLDCGFNRDFEYKHTFIKKRDRITKINTEDKCTIDFVLLPNGTNIEDIVDDEYDGIPAENVLMYETFVNNGMSVDNLNLHGENDIVLKSSYCNILLGYPVNYKEHVVFTVHADDEIVGFSRKELALKAMQRYYLLWYLCKNYDITKGTIVSEELAKERKIVMFEPTAYFDEWTNNGLVSLEYKKETDQWEFNCYEYI